MSITIREQILETLKTNLVGMTPTTPIHRSRSAALQRQESPAICIEPILDTPDPSVIGVIQWKLQLRVAVIVRGDTPDQLADPIVNGLHAVMLADKSLGGLIMDIEPSSVKFKIFEADQPGGVIECEYRIDYRTKATDLTTNA